jgi:hypothetical protein
LCGRQAHWKASCSIVITNSPFFMGGGLNKSTYPVEFMLSGSFHTFHVRMCGSARKVEITPVAYSSKRGQEELPAKAWPLWIQMELCTPGIGLRGWPHCGSDFQQESNNTNIGLMPLLTQIARKGSMRLGNPHGHSPTPSRARTHPPCSF